MRVLLDANLATLLVLGSADRRMIGTHKRIQKYTRRDFDDLTAELAKSDAVIFLPNTLTEVSNLIALGIGGHYREAAFAKFRELIDGSEEHYVQSAIACARNEFSRLGLTDAAILAAIGPNWLLLTDDDLLYVAALTAGCQARNFQHIRAER